MQTPKEWTKKTKIFSKTTVTDIAYNYDDSSYVYQKTISLCWQPVEADAEIKERGRVKFFQYQSVLYDDIAINEGDIICVEDIGWLEITSISRYLSHRLLIAHSTERRCQDAGN